PATNPRDTDTTPRVNIQEFCEEYYEDILPIIMDKVRKDQQKDVYTRLDFGEGPRERAREDSRHSNVRAKTTKPEREADSRDTLRGRNSTHGLNTSRVDCLKDRERFRGIRESYDDSFSHSCRDGNRSRHMKRRDTKSLSKKIRIQIGRQEVIQETRNGYKDLKAAFLAYFMQQKKYVKDPVEIHDIKQRDEDTIEDFMECFKAETGRIKGAPECMRIFGFMHGLNNPELMKRLNEHVPKTMEEMMTTTTAFIRGEAAAASKKKGHVVTQEKEGGLTGSPPHKDAKRNPSGRSKQVSVATTHGDAGRKEEQQQVLTTKAPSDHRRRHSFHKSMDELHDCKVVVTLQREERTRPANFKVALHLDVPDQEVAIGRTLSDKEHTELCSILKKNLDIFAWKPSDMRECRAPKRAKAIQAEVQKLVEAGIMREVYYHDWLSNPVMDCYPLSEIDWKVESLYAYPFKCFLDAYKGYHQIQLAEADEEKTAFHTGQGVYCYTKMPFGLKNAGATYQRLMDKVFEGQIRWNIEVYVYNLVVKIYTEAEMMRDIEETFRTLHKFTASNNEAEYEALVAGLRIAARMGVKDVHVSVDSKLVANQVLGIDYQIHRPITRHPQHPLTPIMAPWLFYKWGIDIAGPFSEGPGKVKFLIVTMDYFKKWIEVKAVATITGGQSNGLVERVNQSLGQGIKSRLGEGNKNWIEELPYVLWAHQTMIKSSHGDMSFSLTYETEAIIPTEIGMPTYRTAAVDVVSNNKELRLNLDLLEERRKRAAICEAKAKSKMTKYYNARVRGVTFKPGDFVYRSNDDSHAVAGGKLGPKWEGPYEVTEALGNGAYKLRSIDGTILPRT
nr:reverse transcriptase domain-containing protein [Tanacetum cinerariifolium]